MLRSETLTLPGARAAIPILTAASMSAFVMSAAVRAGAAAWAAASRGTNAVMTMKAHVSVHRMERAPSGERAVVGCRAHATPDSACGLRMNE